MASNFDFLNEYWPFLLEDALKAEVHASKVKRSISVLLFAGVDKRPNV